MRPCAPLVRPSCPHLVRPGCPHLVRPVLSAPCAPTGLEPCAPTGSVTSCSGLVRPSLLSLHNQPPPNPLPLRPSEVASGAEPPRPGPGPPGPNPLRTGPATSYSGPPIPLCAPLCARTFGPLCAQGRPPLVRPSCPHLVRPGCPHLVRPRWRPHPPAQARQFLSKTHMGVHQNALAPPRTMKQEYETRV